MSQQPANGRERNGAENTAPARDLKQGTTRRAATVPPARLFSFLQAQAYLGGLSEWKLRTLVAAHRLPVVIFSVADEEGCKWFFDRADLDRLIETSKKLY